MANAITGSVALSCQLVQQLDAGSNRISAYPVPVSTSLSQSYSPGTGPNQVNKLAQAAGTTTPSSPLDVDLSTLPCVDGTTGFAHVREVIVFNDDATNVLTLGDDGVVTNAFAAWSAGTTARVLIQPGCFHRICKPLGTNGYTIDSTHKKLRLDPGAAAIAYRVVVAGD